MESEPILFRHVLIVDANRQHQKVLAASLTRLIDRIQVSFCDPEGDAWPDESYNWKEIDLVLADAGSDKSRLKAWFSALLEKINLPPVIFLDSKATIDDAVEMMRLGAIDYLDKRGLKDARLQRSLKTAWDNREPFHDKNESPDPSSSTGVIMADKIREATEEADQLIADKIREATEEADQLIADKIREVAENADWSNSGSFNTDIDSNSFMLSSASDDSSTSWFKLPSIGDDFPFTPEDIQNRKAIIGNYYILEFLGIGSNTQVFKAEAIESKELFAIKILSPGIDGDESALNRFIREYQLVKDFDHPHIIQAYEQNTEGDWPFMVMEYCAKGDLQSQMKQRIPREKAISYAAQIASGLHGAHSAGLVHRDIKPSNILCRQNNTLVLVDFGIVKKQTTEEQAMTDEGKMVGTPYYMSPEQARGGKLDGRSDLYALGVILFEMLEGKRPFTGDTPIDVIFAHVQNPIPKLTQEWDELNDIIQRLLAKDIDERYATGLEVIKVLKKISPESVDDSLLSE